VDLVGKVRESIEGHHLLSEGETVVVGVSGGPDSLCLLHVLCRIRGDYGLHLHVAHLHHGLRGAEADADADFVEAIAADWNVPCTVGRADVPSLAREHGLAVEEAARRARYGFLTRVAEAAGAHTIAVAHNADDQAETVLMHWIRGSGLAGLRGMMPSILLGDYRLLEGGGNASQSLTSLPDLRLIRPLLEVMRTEVEAYCDFYGLTPRFDRSNLDTTYFRNWLRHEVLPLLAQHNPNVREVMRRSAWVIADDYALLRSLLEETWADVVLHETADEIVFRIEQWRSLPTGLQRSTLREGIHRLRRSLRDINFVHVENALRVACEGSTGAKATLPRGLMLSVEYDHLTLASADADRSLPDWPLLPAGTAPFPVAVPGATVLPQSFWLLEMQELDRECLPADWEANVDPWRAFLDADEAGSALWLRTRRVGDRFQPLGMGGHTVKLSDFLTNQKVPYSVRDRLPLLIGEQGIMWVCGQRIDERARVQSGTRLVLNVHFRNAKLPRNSGPADSLVACF
jgi:tRNA(Ile)-lysidine synthase